MRYERLREVFQQHARSAFFGWRAARESVTYWSGRKAWGALRLSQKRRLARLTPKVAAEWDALFSTKASVGDAARLQMPVHLIFGSKTRRPARQVCELLMKRLPNARLTCVEGAAHLAPITHANIVNPVLMASVGAFEQHPDVQAAIPIRRMS